MKERQDVKEAAAVWSVLGLIASIILISLNNI
jgi:hypothetical protein